MTANKECLLIAGTPLTFNGCETVNALNECTLCKAGFAIYKPTNAIAGTYLCDPIEFIDKC